VLQVLEKASAAKGVLVTAGELGCSYAFKKADGEGNHTGCVPVLEVKVEDTTGAGDAFLAGFLFSMLQVPDTVLCRMLVGEMEDWERERKLGKGTSANMYR